MSNTSPRNAETLRKFQRDVSRLLTDTDRDYLHDLLKDFHSSRSVEHLVTSLKSCLDTPKKLDLLVDIRNLLPASYRNKFDNLAPYNMMSKPFRPPSQTEMHKSHSTNSLKSRRNGSFRVVNIQKPTPDSSLGFSIRGGREFGTGVYISNVDENTMALKEGLQVGDQVIECNGIDFENITHSSAVKLLSGISKVKLVVKSEGRVPEFNEIKAGFSWVDSHGLPVEDVVNDSDNSDKASSGHHSLEFQPNINLLNSVDEKRINFVIDSENNEFIGFNIRGGNEYGLGIYVSKVDRGSVAEHAGLQVGDLILNVNGTSFESIAHQDAVNLLKSQQHIIMTVKSVGILPASQLFYSDVCWIYPDGTKANVSHETRQNMSTLSVPDTRFQEALRRDSSVQVDLIELSPSPSLSRSEIGIQAEIPVKDIQIEVSESELYESPKEALLEKKPAKTPQEISIQTDPPQASEPSPYDVIQAASPYVTSLNTKTAKLKSGDDESTGSVNERSSNGSGVSGDDLLSRSGDNEDGSHRKSDKRKVKKSKSFLQKQGDKIKAKLSFRKKGDQKHKVRKKGYKEIMNHVDNRCKNLLDDIDYNTVMTEIKSYKDQEVDVEGLVNNLLVTLDTPRKAILLRDIRGVILPYDVGRFDAMISNREVEALEFYGNKAPASPVLEDNEITTKPKKTLVEAVQDSHGNFHLRTRSEAEQIKKTREELKKERLALKVQGSSILEREAKKSGHDDRASWSNENANNNIEMGPMIQVIDASADSPHLSTFGVPSPPPILTPDLPAVEVDDTSFTNPASSSEFGSFLTVPDRVSVEYKEAEKQQLSFELPKIRTSMGRCRLD
ncbi:PDZ domain-containing protein 7-like [Dendronephthya gigantea]|uniref:PDZ domain-containing protein 7-like n=1 Tax=Dendronephthya gigantea TaxID=151771 RepID=UPI0010694238|nr:PDZ domain-containing protein 7-like [Dendronephthya gigantea]